MHGFAQNYPVYFISLSHAGTNTNSQNYSKNKKSDEIFEDLRKKNMIIMQTRSPDEQSVSSLTQLLNGLRLSKFEGKSIRITWRVVELEDSKQEEVNKLRWTVSYRFRGTQFGTMNKRIRQLDNKLVRESFHPFRLRINRPVVFRSKDPELSHRLIIYRSVCV